MRAQSALEYVLLIGGALVVIAIVMVLLYGFAGDSESKISEDAKKLDDLTKEFETQGFSQPVLSIPFIVEGDWS
ncbi:MAG: hypothetical protein ABH803_04340 [Candidatus Micrarchaeota archaeon]